MKKKKENEWELRNILEMKGKKEITKEVNE